MAVSTNYGTGRRKTGKARVFLKAGRGRIMINGKPHGPQQGVASCQTYLRSFRDGDVIVVDTSATKVALSNVLRVLPLATSAAIFVPLM